MIRILFFLVVSLNFSFSLENKSMPLLKNDIEIESIELNDGRMIAVKINKYIDKNLTNIKVVLLEGNKSIEYHFLYERLYPSVETNNSITVYLANNRTFFYTWWGDGHNFTIMVDADEIKSYVFKKHVDFDMPETLFSMVLLLILLFFAMIFFWYIGLFNRNIQKIINNPNKIFDMPLHKLPYYKKLLKKRVEYRNNISAILENNIDKVSNFFEVTSVEKADVFAQKANGNIRKIDENFFEIQLSQNFELSLESFLLYFPSTTSINEMYTILKDKRATAIIVIGQNEEEQRFISESNQLLELPNVIGISLRNLKLFLLQSEHTKILAQIFSDKIDRTLISPYQSEGKVENELYFFGREKIMENIYNKELSNYFIVGARQIGKSSLLKALERKFKDREDVICITIEDTRYLLKEMATSLELDRKSSLEEIEVFISNSSKKYLFLIDEVDAFVQDEKENNYEMLHAFRALSQKKKAYFIMAGYWELFSQISFDYYSPIKNFGETIKLDKLEVNACSELLIRPMENLNLNYDSAEDAVEILRKTGQRANLIAMVCDKIVKDLKPLSFVITKDDVENALYYNDELQKTYYSWKEIPNNKRQSYITQMIVYASVEVDYFSLESVIELFESLDLLDKVTLEEIEESLQRLDLMYIIEKNKHNIYWYTIPLMKEELMKDSNVRLKKVIDEFRKI